MKLTWHGHSCFTLETDRGSLVMDPMVDNYVPGFGPINAVADAVYCSHGHSDHHGLEAVTLTGNPCTVEVETVPSWHDEAQGSKRGSNTIHCFRAEGMRVVHLGDLGCLLTEEQAAPLKGCDVLLLPVGGFYTIGPEEAKAVADHLSPRIIIPMHYKGDTFGYDVLARVEDFLALCGSFTRLEGPSFTVTPETPAGVYVPTYLG